MKVREKQNMVSVQDNQNDNDTENIAANHCRCHPCHFCGGCHVGIIFFCNLVTCECGLREINGRSYEWWDENMRSFGPDAASS